MLIVVQLENGNGLLLTYYSLINIYRLVYFIVVLLYYINDLYCVWFRVITIKIIIIDLTFIWVGIRNSMKVTDFNKLQQMFLIKTITLYRFKNETSAKPVFPLIIDFHVIKSLDSMKFVHQKNKDFYIIILLPTIFVYYQINHLLIEYR